VAFGALDPIGVAQFTAPKLLANSAVLNNRQRSFAGPKGTTTTRTLKPEEFGAKLRKVPISDGQLSRRPRAAHRVPAASSVPAVPILRVEVWT
jgi:hypothetical protein